MAIMSRKKKATAQGWGATDEERRKANQNKELEKKEVTQEEHEERIKQLKEMGLIKE